MRTRFEPADGSTARARAFRQNASEPERRLWSVLRGGALGGYKFRRQQRLGPYFADFCCQAARLVIEVDGDTHAQTAVRDERRTAYLEQEGYRVVRFGNGDVMGSLEGVAASILVALKPSPSHSPAASGPLPLPRGERDK